MRDEFDAILECGILTHGFLRLRCGDCGHDGLKADDADSGAVTLMHPRFGSRPT